MGSRILPACLLLIVAPASNALDEDYFIEIFDHYNEALKQGDLQALEKYLVRIQMSVTKECLSHPVCGPDGLERMKNGALAHYTVTNFVEYSKDGCLVQIRDVDADIEPVNGPAYQLYYEGVEVSGQAGKGYAGFVYEDGVWKVGMTTWGAR